MSESLIFIHKKLEMKRSSPDKNAEQLMRKTNTKRHSDNSDGSKNHQNEDFELEYSIMVQDLERNDANSMPYLDESQFRSY